VFDVESFPHTFLCSWSSDWISEVCRLDERPVIEKEFIFSNDLKFENEITTGDLFARRTGGLC
jgi:hypothetical protein